MRTGSALTALTYAGLVLRALALTAVLCGLSTAPAVAAYAPVDRPGPSLSVPRDQLAGALACTGGVDGAPRTPVLLVHGTGGTREENWSASYQPALSSFGIPWCAVQLPERATGDIQTSAEYVVHAIRDMRRRAGRRISIIGASQGGALPRWALRFWPDTRPMVDDLVALAPTNHGTRQARLVCRRACQPAQWQQMDGSRYIGALNSVQETFRGISYTNAYTAYDEIVRPPESAVLTTGDGRITNVRIQDVCPLNTSTHLLLSTADPVGFALAIDALAHDGPADFARVAARRCAQPGLPGFDPVKQLLFAPSFLTGKAADTTTAEPPLRCYVTASCAVSRARRPRLLLSVSPRRAASGEAVRLRVRVRGRRGGRLRAVRGVVIRTGGRRARTDRRGRATLRVRYIRRGRRRVTAHARGFLPGRAAVRVASPRSARGR